MRAVVMTSAGEALRVQELPQPQIQQPADLLIRVMAAGINPVDTKISPAGTLSGSGCPHDSGYGWGGRHRSGRGRGAPL